MEGSGVHHDLGKIQGELHALQGSVKKVDADVRETRNEVHKLAVMLEGYRPQTGEVPVPRSVPRLAAAALALVAGALLSVVIHLHVELRSRMDAVEIEIYISEPARSAIAACVRMRFQERLGASETRSLRPMDETSREKTEECVETLRAIASIRRR